MALWLAYPWPSVFVSTFFRSGSGPKGDEGSTILCAVVVLPTYSGVIPNRRNVVPSYFVTKISDCGGKSVTQSLSLTLILHLFQECIGTERRTKCPEIGYQNSLGALEPSKLINACTSWCLDEGKWMGRNSYGPISCATLHFE